MRREKRSKLLTAVRRVAPVLGIALAAALVVGCEERAMRGPQNSAAPETQPAVTAVPPLPSASDAQQAGATQPHTAPADAQPANAFLTIEGKVTEFPPARLRLTRTAEGMTALLYSDDPKTATSAQYKGNSFYFDVPLKAREVEDLVGAEYAFRAEDSEPVDSPNGIFLVGTRYHLQPQDAVIRFDGEGNRIMAQVVGRFLVVRTSGDNVPGQMAAVQGTLYTTAELED